MEFDIKTKNNLKVKLIELWNNILQEFVKKLIKSMNKRCLAVKKAKSGHINY